MTLAFILIGFLGSQSYQALCGAACLGQLLMGADIVTTEAPAQASCHEVLTHSDAESSHKLIKLNCSHDPSLTARYENSLELEVELPLLTHGVQAFSLATHRWVLKSEGPPQLGPPIYILHQKLVI